MAAAGSSNLAHGFPTPGPQRPTGNRVMNHVFFLTDEGWKNSREEAKFDLVIVGSGFCGYAVAEQALKNNPQCRILLLERGPFFLPEHFQNLPQPFDETLGGLSETFPWTVSARTALGREGTITWQHGMVPFLGGRSTLWSAWCPRPTDEEMNGWSNETKNAVHNHIEGAEKLLSVQPAGATDMCKDNALLRAIALHRPVYNKLQTCIQTSLKAAPGAVQGIYRTEAAPLASGWGSESGIDFAKFSVPGELLQLIRKSESAATEEEARPFSVVTDCVVEKILHQEDRATALQTSRGVLPLVNANLILAMGTLPPTTLVANSFPDLTKTVGQRFSAHFITSIVAHVPLAHLKNAPADLASLELAACYVGGIANDSYEQQFHIQLSALWDEAPEKNAEKALRYMPDVVATASLEQLRKSKDHVVFVCAVLGELEANNDNSWFRKNELDSDLTTNSLLQVAPVQADLETWDAMDKATFQILENVLCTDPSQVRYWHQSTSSFTNVKPTKEERRVDALVHESSTMHIGTTTDDPVDTDYKLRGTENVYVTGGCLWPRGGSWNPTLAMVAMAQDLANKLVPGHK